MQDGGELDAAEHRYRELLETAPDEGDRRWVHLKLAQLAAERGDTQTALERYRKVWSGEARDAHGARAMWEASEISEAQGKSDERRELRRRLVIRYPATSWAEQAVESLTADVCTRDCAALPEFTEKLHAEVEGTPVADNLYIAAAEQLEDAGRDERAERLYRRQLERYPDGTMADDAEWALGSLYVRRQQWPAALPYLERVAERVKVSWAVGTYNSPWASKARFRLGWLHLTHLGNYGAAVEHFERYLKDFPRNALADDALWHISQAHRLAGRDAQRRAALRRLLEEFPDSRHAEVARRRLAGPTTAGGDR